MFTKVSSLGTVALSFLFAIVLMISSCEKMIEINPPISAITQDEAFADSGTAVAIVSGLYGYISERASGLFGSAYLSAIAGLYADEIEQSVSFSTTQAFYAGNIPINNIVLKSNVWGQPYFYIYHTNVIIDEVNKSNLSESLKIRLTSEAKFFRAFCYFYLINLFGDVPLITQPDYKQNTFVPKTAVDSIYKFIISELQQVKAALKNDYSSSDNQRTRINSFCASSLLAKCYLQLKAFPECLTECDRIINATNIYSLATDPVDAFNINSPEAIFQFDMNNQFQPYNSTGEGNRFVYPTTPRYFLSSPLLAEFNEGDRRRQWIDSVFSRGRMYYFPFKYKIGLGNQQPGGSTTQYSTVFRLAEIYLIRAECHLETGNLPAALDDINIIRLRAGKNEFESESKDDIFAQLIKEKRIELFCEFGNRWIDLKRWNLADEINRQIKTDWQPYRKLFPIPMSEVQNNPALIQNVGY